MNSGHVRLRVLMVCTGNICRSPTAEAVLRSRLQVAGLAHEVEVESAGTQGFHAGEAPDARAQEHARRRGYELGGHLARRVDPADFSLFHWILAMDRSHVLVLRQQCPAGLEGRIRLLMDFARAPSVAEVPDPYYGGPEGFERVLDLVESATEGLVQMLQRQLLGAGLTNPTNRQQRPPQGFF